MKVIIDCNVLISAGVGSKTCRELITTILRYHQHYLSDPILEEYYEVCSRSKFIKNKKRIHELMRTVCSRSVFVSYVKTGIDLNDKKDEKYLDTALIAEVDYIITGNIKDLPTQYGKINICNPATFLQLYSKQFENGAGDEVWARYTRTNCARELRTRWYHLCQFLKYDEYRYGLSSP